MAKLANTHFPEGEWVHMILRSFQIKTQSVSNHLSLLLNNNILTVAQQQK